IAVLADATKLPELIEVSIEGRPAGEHLLAGQVELPAGVELVADEELLIVNVSEEIEMDLESDAEEETAEAATEEAAADEKSGAEEAAEEEGSHFVTANRLGRAQTESGFRWVVGEAAHRNRLGPSTCPAGRHTSAGTRPAGGPAPAPAPPAGTDEPHMSQTRAEDGNDERGMVGLRPGQSRTEVRSDPSQHRTAGRRRTRFSDRDLSDPDEAAVERRHR